MEERERRLKDILKRLNLRFDRSEISGSLGDLGTFLPLAVGMASRCGMNLGHILFFAGIMNLGSGLMFGIPVAVQPMKVIAAVAIAEGLDAPSIAAAGILAGAVVMILGVTGLIGILGKIIPGAVVRGLQLAIGIKLILSGLDMARASGFGLTADSAFTAVALFIFVLIFIRHRNIPVAMILFLIGMTLVFYNNPRAWGSLRAGWEFPGLLTLTGADFVSGFVKGTMPQIPLTILNSVIAVCALSGDLFPDRPLDARKIVASIGFMNLIACPLGGMPMCHGAGGLAAQYRFGARTGGSVVFLGLAKIALALAFGGSLLTIISLFPGSVLGVLLIFAGWQMAVVCKDIRAKREATFLALTASACLLFGMAAGFAAGLVVVLSLDRWIPRSESGPARKNLAAGTTVAEESD